MNIEPSKRRRSRLSSPFPSSPFYSLSLPCSVATTMGSIHNSKSRLNSNTITPCTRTHQIGALALVITTFFLTRIFDQSFNRSSFSIPTTPYRSKNDVVRFSDSSSGSIFWPQRGYGTHLSLKIYVYDENEIDGLKHLLYGRDEKISPDSCLKGQWGTQVVSSIFPCVVIGNLFLKLNGNLWFFICITNY